MSSTSRPLHWFPALLLALVGAAPTLPRLKLGWSALDDGFYAYAAEKLLQGAVIHRDFSSGFLGYQHLLHALSFLLFGHDYLSLRAVLPLLTLLSGITAAALFRPYGWRYQLLAIVVVSSFSFLLFNNPSASWTAAYLALLLVWLSIRGNQTQGRTQLRWFFLQGLVLGVTFGVRHPTAVFLGIAALLSMLQACPATRDDRLQWWSTWPAALAVVGLLAYGHLSGSLSNTALWFCGPIMLALLGLQKSFRINPHSITRFVASCGSGFLLGILPIILYTAATGTLSDLLRDMRIFPANYSELLGVGTWSTPQLMQQVLLHQLTPTTLASSLVVTITMTYSLLVCLLGLGLSLGLIQRDGRIARWLHSPLTIFATLHVLVVLGLLRDMYFGYLMPLVFLSLAEAIPLARRDWVRTASSCLLVLCCATAALVMSARLGLQGSYGYLGAQPRSATPTSSCSLPRCNLEILYAYSALLQNLEPVLAVHAAPPAERTVHLLPHAYFYLFSYQPVNETVYPDIRPLTYKGIPAQTLFDNMRAQPNPVIVIFKFDANTAFISEELADLIVKNSRKVYEDDLYIVFLPKQAGDKALES